MSAPDEHDNDLTAPFIYFGGKRSIAPAVWERFGAVKQYIEPFCGSAAVLLAAPKVASLEVVGDVNGFIANFWRAVKHQPDAVAHEADYPVSHIDLGARHVWLMAQRQRLADELADPHWPGDARVAGWWLWGQCAWIGGGWCDWHRVAPVQALGRIPAVGNAGRGFQAIGQIPSVGEGGRGIHAIGKIPSVGEGGRGIHAIGKIPSVGDIPPMLTSSGRTAWVWLHRLADRLERVRVIHGAWDRCLHHSYGVAGSGACAVFLDPPYRAYEALYGAATTPVADAVCEWARNHPTLRIALCGHVGDYDLPGWEVLPWTRTRLTYGSDKTRDQEAVWFSPACLGRTQGGLFA